MGINKRLFAENREAEQLEYQPHQSIEKTRKDLETIISDSISELKAVDKLKTLLEINKRLAEGFLATLNEAQPTQQ